jgi:hypothetical protein
LKKVSTKYLALFIFIVGAFLASVKTYAQDLEPRFLSNMPVKTNVVVGSYAFSSGNIMLDNTLPIEDLSSTLNSFVFGYVRSFKLFNKAAKFDVIVPTSFSNFEGVYNDIDSSTSRTGFGDPSFRLSMILIGAKPATISEFAKQEYKKFKMGALLRVRLPLGQYNPSKLINLGTNRYSIKTGIAGSYAFQKKLTLEFHLNSWFFTENKFFYNGNTLKQKPLLAAQTHISYEFKPGV